MKALDIYIKEIRDISRDRRTVIAAVILPVVLIPVLFRLIHFDMKKFDGASGTYTVSITGPRSRPVEFIRSLGNISVAEYSDPSAALNEGRVHCLVAVKPHAAGADYFDIDIAYDGTRHRSIAAMAAVTAALESFSKKYAGEAIKNTGAPARIISPVSVTATPLRPRDVSSSLLYLGILIPVFVLIFAAASPLATAADLFAGEKERGTIEPLLACPVSGIPLLAGKISAVVTAGATGVISFFIGLYISTYTSPLLYANRGLFELIHPKNFIMIAAVGILLTLVFSSLELMISVFARSSKETQTFGVPILILSAAAGTGSVMIEVKNISAIYLHVPIVNNAIIIREMVLGEIIWPHALICGAWDLGLTALCISLSAFIFSRRNLIFRS